MHQARGGGSGWFSPTRCCTAPGGYLVFAAVRIRVIHVGAQ
jgi:hypothetical protein